MHTYNRWGFGDAGGWHVDGTFHRALTSGAKIGEVKKKNVYILNTSSCLARRTAPLKRFAQLFQVNASEHCPTVGNFRGQAEGLPRYGAVSLIVSGELEDRRCRSYANILSPYLYLNFYLPYESDYRNAPPSNGSGAERYFSGISLLCDKIQKAKISPRQLARYLYAPFVRS